MSFIQLDGLLLTESADGDYALNEGSIENAIEFAINSIKATGKSAKDIFNDIISSLKGKIAAFLGNDTIDKVVKESESAGERLGKLKVTSEKDANKYLAKEVNEIFSRNILGQFKHLASKSGCKAIFVLTLVLIAAVIISHVIFAIISLITFDIIAGIVLSFTIGILIVLPISIEYGRRFMMKDVPDSEIEQNVMAYSAATNIAFIASHFAIPGLVLFNGFALILNMLMQTYLSAGQVVGYKRDRANGISKTESGKMALWINSIQSSIFSIALVNLPVATAVVGSGALAVSAIGMSGVID